MSKLSKKLKIFKNSTNKTYTVNLYSTKAEALNSPFKIILSDGTTAYVPSRPAKTDTPLAFTYKNKTYYVTNTVSGDVVLSFDNSKMYTTSGTFTVPNGVTTIYVTASAGGGGSGGSAYFAGMTQTGGTGGTGGNTSVGNLITLRGGTGGTGAVGLYSTSWPPLNVTTQNGTNGTSYSSSAVKGYANYGGGGAGVTGGYTHQSGNGGRGENCTQKAFTVTANSTINITVGSGGSGGSSNYTRGNAGQSGFVLIEWDNP